MRRERFPLLLAELYGCGEKIGDADHVRAYAKEICSQIGMKRRGRSLLVRRRGRLGGLSAAQVIETSHVIVHCYPAYRFAVADIFSCKGFDRRRAAKFSGDYFGASSYRTIFRLV